MIEDSGNRTEFSTGAVRDIQEGKGRCDLLPLDIVARWMRTEVMRSLSLYTRDSDVVHLYHALDSFVYENADDDSLSETVIPNAILEVAVHFEEGAKKYGERNWEKGIPTARYLDSAIRHYLKYERGDNDERHDRAFIWNILCMLWTIEHKENQNESKENDK